MMQYLLAWNELATTERLMLHNPSWVDVGIASNQINGDERGLNSLSMAAPVPNTLSQGGCQSYGGALSPLNE